MLYKLVERICADIDRLDLGLFGGLAEPIQEAAPDTIAFIRDSRKRGKKLTYDEVAKTQALVAFTFIKSIPRTARAMVDKVKDRRVHAARRCAVASVLAYLVQPHDIIPDDAPGYYGYLDDAILLHAGLVEYLDTLPAGSNADSQARMVNYLIALTPEHVRPALQLAVSSMSQVVQILSMMGPEIAEGTLAQIVANPLQASSTVAAPPGFSPRAARDYGGGHWSGGNYFEGNNVIMGGGGPALIDGQLFIPG